MKIMLHLLSIQEKHKCWSSSNVPLGSQSITHAYININLCESGTISAILESLLFSKALEDGFYHPAGGTGLTGEESNRCFVAL